MRSSHDVELLVVLLDTAQHTMTKLVVVNLSWDPLHTAFDLRDSIICWCLVYKYDIVIFPYPILGLDGGEVLPR